MENGYTIVDKIAVFIENNFSLQLQKKVLHWLPPNPASSQQTCVQMLCGLGEDSRSDWMYATLVECHCCSISLPSHLAKNFCSFEMIADSDLALNNEVYGSHFVFFWLFYL